MPSWHKCIIISKERKRIERSAVRGSFFLVPCKDFVLTATAQSRPNQLWRHYMCVCEWQPERLKEENRRRREEYKKSSSFSKKKEIYLAVYSEGRGEDDDQ